MLVLQLSDPLLIGELHVLPLVQELFVATTVHLDLHRELVCNLSGLPVVYITALYTIENDNWHEDAAAEARR